MPKLKALWMRFSGLLRARRADADFAAELEAHVALHTEDGIRAGLSREEARRQALIDLGGVEQTRQAYRERATMPSVDSVFQDVRFALRQMRKAPGFTLTAVLTLALGIGANAVIYILVDSILLRPLPYAQQNRLMRISDETASALPKGWIRALGEHSRAFASIAGFGPDTESNISDSGTPDRVFGAQVTVNALDTLGIRPALGEFFTPSDAIAGQDHDVVLSYGYWREHFGGSPAVLGSSLRIDGVYRRMIGVMPPGVHFPYAETQFVIPVSFRGGDVYDAWTDFDLQAFGRLADGVTPRQAQADLRRLHGILLPLFPWRMPDSWASEATVMPLLEAETGSMRPRLLLLFGAVGLILLIACANVANLMLARAAAREHEIAIRGALGASGRRLIRQLLSESVVLGVTAGAVGLVAALASLHIFVSLLPADTPRIQDIGLHSGDILFTLGTSVLAGVLFGLIPSLKVASVDMLTALRMGARGLTGKGSRFGASMALVAAQIGLSVVVIAAAGLMLHSLYNISRVDPGFRTGGTLTAEVSLDAGSCGTPGRCFSFFTTLLEQSRSIAGVDGTALADALPLSGHDSNYVYDAEDHPRSPRQGAFVATGRIVSPAYFRVLGLQLVRGRLLNEQDNSGASHAAVIDQRMAERLWPNQNPIGKQLENVSDEPSPTVLDPAKTSIVVGVVQNARDGSLEGGFNDEVYLPMTPTRDSPVMYVLLRSRGAPEQTAAVLRRAVAGIDSLAPVTRVRTLNEVVANSVAAPRTLAILLLGFGCLAVFIGAVGVYSLIAYIVSWRVHEIGLRLALGARRWQIVMAIVRQSLLLAGSGCAAGLLATLAAGRLLRSFLFEVSALDPITLCAVPLLMVVVALVAAWIPARRAASVDPMQALRAE